MTKKNQLAWSGSQRPRDPNKSIGLVDSVGVGVSDARPARPSTRPRSTGFEEGLHVEVNKMEPGDKPTSRPGGRMPLKP